MSAPRRGADLLCEALESLGVEHVFGLPGTQTVPLYEALRKSRLRSVLMASELGAAFAANGYYRTSGRVGVVVAIPGPGFTYTLTGLAEARLDSAAVVLITGKPPTDPRRRFLHQQIDQTGMARPLVKGVVDVDRAADMWARLTEAWDLAAGGEPGPVVVQVAEAVWGEEAEAGAPAVRRGPAVADARQVTECATLLRQSRRPLLFLGQGAAGAAAEVQQLAERLGAPVVTTTSGRGVIAEDHALSLSYAAQRAGVVALNRLTAAADVVVVIGAKLSHNGTGGFDLVLPRDKLVHVDASSDVLNANYPARLAIQGDARSFISSLLENLAAAAPRWSVAEVAQWRSELEREGEKTAPEPQVPGVGGMDRLFTELRRVLPRDAIVVTDSGLHQNLVRRHLPVFSARGLVTPSDLQSMGFGLPAAIGAKLAAPERPVVAVIGDGGFTMTGLELLAAVRAHVPITVIVLNDGQLNLIRLQQLREYGHAHDVKVGLEGLELIAAGLGVRYVPITSADTSALRGALATDAPVLIEIPVGDSGALRLTAARAAAREAARGLLGPRVVGWIKRLLRRS